MFILIFCIFLAAWLDDVMSGVLFPENKVVPLQTQAQLQLWSDGSSAWLWLLLRGENTNNQGQEQQGQLQWITRDVVFSGFAFSIPG